MPPEAEPLDRPTDLEGLLFTLAICRRALPWDAHPAHIDRLQRIEQLVRWGMAQREDPTRIRSRDTASCPERHHDLAY